MLLTSAGTAPFNLRNVFTGQDTLGTHLIQLVREVHRPYRDSVSIVSDYLLRNAERDDLVYVPGFADREVLRCSGLPASGRGGHKLNLSMTPCTDYSYIRATPPLPWSMGSERSDRA